MTKIGFVIPTTLSRPEYLRQAYESIANQPGGFLIEIIVGCPEDKVFKVSRILPSEAIVVAESKESGLARKLDDLLRRLSQECEYIAWLGDDDLLTDRSLVKSIGAMEADPSASLVYGGCDYIDSDGKVILTNKSGRWASKILNFGPQLIPQPGSIMRRSAYIDTGGLSNRYSLAFDYDLFIKLKKQGNLMFVPETLAQFRWHPTSLSVKSRSKSVKEASNVRASHYPAFLKPLSWVWEPLIIISTWMAGKLVTLKTRR